jgi:hypothetical protein
MALIFEVIANFVLEMLMSLMSLRAWLWTIGAIVVAFLVFVAHSHGLLGS